MVRFAVDPETTGAVPWMVPSSVNVTTPVGTAEPAMVALTVAVSSMDAPAVGVVVEGDRSSVVGVVATVMVTAGDVALE